MCMEFRSYKHCTGQKPPRIKLIRCVRNTHTTCTYKTYEATDLVKYYKEGCVFI